MIIVWGLAYLYTNWIFREKKRLRIYLQDKFGTKKNMAKGSKSVY